MTRHDEERIKATEAASDQAANKAVEHALEAFGSVVKEEVGAAKRRLGVLIENVDKNVSAVVDALEGTTERADNQKKRIERLEDTAGLPTWVPAIEG